MLRVFPKTRKTSPPTYHHQRRWSNVLRHVSIALGTVIIWETIVRIFDVPRYLIPRASTTFLTLIDQAQPLFADAAITVLEALGGLIIASLCAFGLAVLSVYLPATERLVLPYVVALQAIPLVAIAPLLIIWFGNGYLSKVVLAALVSFFPMTINSVVGLRRVSPETLDVFRLFGASRTQILCYLRIPTAVPFLMTGLRIGSGLSIIGAIVAELAGANRGIGFTIIMAQYQNKTPELFAALLVAASASIAFYGAVRFLEKRANRKFCPQHEAINITDHGGPPGNHEIQF